MSFIEISKESYFHNLDILSKKLGSKDTLAVVLKDNAYGHGVLEIAKLSSEFGIKRAIVRDLSEAYKIERYFESIVILSEQREFKSNKKFSYIINDLSYISGIEKNCSVHLKIDTGMHRNGIAVCDINRAYEEIAKRGLILDGIMTHFRSADELSSDLYWQMRVWSDVKEKILKLTKEYGYKKPLFHSANSSAVFRVKEYDDDFARCGIATYGYIDLPHVFKQPRLKPVLRLYAQKISSRVLKESHRVGYGGEFEAEKDMVVSTYDIGYSDGLFRYDGKGVLKSSDGLRFLGRVSMDSCELEGDRDRVLIFSDAREFAKHFNTITYDILTRLSQNILRVIV